MRINHNRRGLYAPELLEARIAPATFIVTNLTDSALGSLRNVIALANAAPGADTIVFDPAILPGTITLNLEISILDSLTIKGPGIDLLAVSGNDLVRTFNIGDGTAALKPTTISGLTLTNGKTAGNGGVLISTEPLTLKDVVVRNSYASVNGGGVFVVTEGKILITGSRIVHNEAGAGGGALYLRGDAGVSVMKTTIADNTASHSGGLYADVEKSKAVLLIDTCLITNNVGTSSGGGMVLNGPSDGKIIIKNSVVTGNVASTAGGGLYSSDGNLFISKTTFANNLAARGGAIGADSVQSLTITGSRFLVNQAIDPAGLGGGAVWIDGPNTVVKIAGSLFSGNVSTARGGAIGNTKIITLGITGSTFLGNTAGTDGGAIHLNDGAVLTMKGTVLSGNLSGNFGGSIYAENASVLNLTGNKITENRATYGGGIFMAGLTIDAVRANLVGNLFQANAARNGGGAVFASQDAIFTSKTDKILANAALTGQGGGVLLANTGGIFITGSLFQGNVAGSSGGGLSIGAGALISGVKVLDNIAGPGGRGGGLRVAPGAATVIIAKSLISGNVANDGGGIFYNLGTTTLTTTVVKSNAALINPNRGKA